MSELSEKIQQYITIDDSGADQDRITVRLLGVVEDVPFDRDLYALIDFGIATLPDGTRFTSDDCQEAFQDALIAKTGRCVLETEYLRAGFPDLVKMVRSMRGADEE